jgi:hypothetical protein
VLEATAFADEARHRSPRVLDTSWRTSPRSATGVELLVFVKAGCDGCDDLVRGARPAGPLDGPFDVRWCVKGGDADRAFAETLPGPVHVGDDVYRACSVTSGPFYVLVDGAGTVLAEGVAFGAEAVRAHLDAALDSVVGSPSPVVRAEQA